MLGIKSRPERQGVAKTEPKSIRVAETGGGWERMEFGQCQIACAFTRPVACRILVRSWLGCCRLHNASPSR
jgi:hypothetical protein